MLVESSGDGVFEGRGRCVIGFDNGLLFDGVPLALLSKVLVFCEMSINVFQKK